MDFPRYLELLQVDAVRLGDVAARGLDSPIPACDGWTVDDVVRHVAEVYLHKIECIRRQAAPDPWSPDLSDRDPIGLLIDSLAELMGELETRGPTASSYTWYAPDQTVGFWYRRMAQETAVHRVDVEQAHGAATPVDGELATDGIDEILAIMLAGDWSDEPVAEAAGRQIRVGTDARSWLIGLDRTEVHLALDDHTPADATISGDPSPVLLWLWGRAPLNKLTVSGDVDAVAALRRRLTLATQ